MIKMLDIQAAKEQQMVEMPNGWIVHMKNGSLHRDDGPAVISDTHQEWYQNGILHRDDGPARLFHVAPDGSEKLVEWWQNGTCMIVGIVDHETFNKHLGNK